MPAYAILWRRLDQFGHDAASLLDQPTGWELAGSAVFAHDGKPVRLDYLVTGDTRWRTRSGRGSRNGYGAGAGRGARMKRLLTMLLLVAMPELASAQVSYSSRWKPYYSRIVEKASEFPASVPVEPPITIPSPMRYGSATLVSTDATRIPYDREEAHITITSKHFPPVYLQVRFFRTVTLTWITDRTVLIDRDIGHIAAIEEILDVIDRRWLSQQSISYGAE